MKKQQSLVFCSSLTYFILLICFVLIRILFLYVDLPFSSEVNDLISTIVVQMGFMFFLSVFLFSKLRNQKISKTFNDFGYKKIKIKPVIICFAIGILCYILNIFFASFFNSIISFCGYEKSPSFSVLSTENYSVVSFILQVLSIAIIPAICEETAHRGLLLKGFSPLGITSSVIMSSILFGLMHLNVNQFFYATILGFMIALSVVISKNIFPAIIIHFVNNFLSVYFTFAANNNWFAGNWPNLFTNFLAGTGNVFSFLLTSILTLGVLVILVCFLYTMLLKETRIKDTQKMLNDISKINRDYNQTPESFNNDANFLNLHNINKLMSEYNIKSMNSMVFTELESKKHKLVIQEKILISACFLIGGIVTVFTFVWGLI